MIPEEMTVTDLLGWANSLGLCTFKKDRRFDRDEALCEGKNGSIRLKLGHFSENAVSHAGEKAVGISVEDERPQSIRPWGSMGYMTTDLNEIKRDIERYGTALNLLNPQMSLF